jgi:serine phosphatase RsbU (regulator of sigma subunit)
MGELSFKLGKVQDSKLHLTTALKHAQEIGAVDLISKVNKLLSTVYEALNDPSRAFLHFKMHISARDSLFNDDNTKRVVQAEMLYEFERQIQESKLEQAKKDAIAQEVAHRQRMFRNFLVSILLLLLVVVGMIYNAYKSKQRANIKLFKQQQQIIEKNEELLQQQDEILAQRDEIEKQNKVLEQSQLIIESKNERIISSIEYAQTIQQAILPDVEQLKRFFPEHIIVYLPKDIVSGDFYWFSAVGQKLFAAVVDCTGHGVPGAFMSLIGNTMLNQIVNEWQTYDPALVLELMHQQVRKALNQDSSTSKAHASMDVCFVSIDLKDKKAVFSGASRPLYIVQDGNLEKISGDPRSVGGFQREVKRYFTNHSIDLSKPTFLYLTTDGYVDQMNLSNRKFSPRRLLRLLIDIHKKPTEIQKDLLISEFEIYREGQEQIDDICILGLKI